MLAEAFKKGLDITQGVVLSHTTGLGEGQSSCCGKRRPGGPEDCVYRDGSSGRHLWKERYHQPKITRCLQSQAPDCQMIGWKCEQGGQARLSFGLPQCKYRLCLALCPLLLRLSLAKAP
jgi:hypothetical protein